MTVDVCNVQASLMNQWSRIRLPIQEMQVRSLGQVDPLEDCTATHSSFLAWEILWTEKPGRMLFMGSQKSWTPLSDLLGNVNRRIPTCCFSQVLCFFLSGQHTAPRNWGHCVRQAWISFSKHSLYDKTAYSRSPLLRYGLSPDLVTIIIPCSLGNSYCTFGFLIFIIDERNFLYYSLYILTEKSLKHLCSIRAWVPCLSFFLSLSLSSADFSEHRDPSCSLSCLGF